MHLEEDVPVEGTHDSCGTQETALIVAHFGPGEFRFGKPGVGPLGLIIQEMSHLGRGMGLKDVLFRDAEPFQILQGNVNSPRNRILRDIAQDIRELQGDTQTFRIPDNDRARGAEDSG